MEAKTKKLKIDLLNWYKKNKRDFSWRKTTDPWRILLIETLSQEIGKYIIEKYSNLESFSLKYVEITIHKPETSLSNRTENISVTYHEQLK